jgi:hypothetical protein
MLALWHLLSLDAPSVAALWTVFVARIFRVALPWTAPMALAVAVWMLYAADRLADAASGKAFEERHRFHQRHSTAFAICWMACAPVLLWLVMHLPHALRDGWLLLAVPLGAYVGAVHALKLGHVPKEPLIGVFFGMAVAMPVMSSGLLTTGLAASVALFALLCWFNCAAIAAWESPWSGYLDPFTRWIGERFGVFGVIAVALSLCSALEGGPARWIGLAVAASLVLLLVLQRLHQRLDRTHLRALADAALLTPVVLLPLLAWQGR